MSQRLTLKQAKFIANIASGMSGTKSVMDAYDTNNANTAAVISSQNLRKLKIMYAINTNLAENQLADQAIERLIEALNAVKRDNGGNSVPDHDIRLKASERTLNLLQVSNGQKPIF